VHVVWRPPEGGPFATILFQSSTESFSDFLQALIKSVGELLTEVTVVNRDILDHV